MCYGCIQYLALGYSPHSCAYSFGGKGKLSSIMGDFGKGLKNFKDQVKSNKDNEEEVEAISEQKVTPKKKAAKKQTKKKQTIKKKS